MGHTACRIAADRKGPSWHAAADLCLCQPHMHSRQGYAFNGTLCPPALVQDQLHHVVCPVHDLFEMAAAPQPPPGIALRQPTLALQQLLAVVQPVDHPLWVVDLCRGCTGRQGQQSAAKCMCTHRPTAAVCFTCRDVGDDGPAVTSVAASSSMQDVPVIKHLAVYLYKNLQ
jgi:hypothetical protein